VWPAVQRIFDLAQVCTNEALHALNRSPVLDLLRHPGSSDSLDHAPIASALTAHQRHLLLGRLQAMAAAGRYEAGVTVASLGGTDQAVVERATQARDRLLNRSEPGGQGFGSGGRIVSDAYLITFLSSAEQQNCLDKLLAVAADRREAAANRQDALAAAANLVLQLDNDIKADVHISSRPFAEGHQDGSFLDAETTNPHPLSFMKINLGTASLRAAGLHLARCSAVTEDDRMWVRQCAVDLLASSDERLVHQGAKTLSSLGEDVVGDLDAALLSTHRLPIVVSSPRSWPPPPRSGTPRRCRTSRPTRIALCGDCSRSGDTEHCTRNLRPAAPCRITSAALEPSSSASSTPFNTTCVTPCGERQLDVLDVEVRFGA
jgi:hypothetical protein